jgi:CBS domain containing-hemolysin-like protein
MNPLALVWMVVFLIANGFFVAAEFAYITARRNVLEGIPGRSARVAIKLNEELSLSLTAAQLGITISSLLLGAVAEPAVAAMIEPALALTPIPAGAVHPIAFAMALLVVVFLHMVIGEMAPKNIAISSPEKSALAMALPFRGFIIALRPLIALLNGAANGVLRLAGVNPATRLDLGHSAADLAMIISAGKEEGVIQDFAHRLLTGAILFKELDASEVMIPRPDVKSAGVDTSVLELREMMRSSGHSRIPIHSGDLDDTLGFVHVKDLLAVEEARVEEPVSMDVVRSLLAVPETAPLRAVLDEMRRERNHLALVVDEHGSVAGIITMEDIAEELVGEINDEHDLRRRTVARRRDGGVLAAGVVRLDQLERLGVVLPAGEYETVGGLVMHRLGRLPAQGDALSVDGWTIEVRSVEGRRVREVLITPRPIGPEDSSA